MTRMMRLTFALITLVAVMPATALNLPSLVSGDYVGEGYGCRLLLQTVRNTGQRGVELKCTRPNNEQTTGLAIGPQTCPNEWYLVPLGQWGGGDVLGANKAAPLQWREYLAPNGTLVTAWGPGINDKTPATWARVVAYDLQTATIRVGSFETLLVGLGTDVILVKKQAVVLSAPYPGCAGQEPARPRVRVFGP